MSFTNAFNKVVPINFISSQLLSTHPFSCLCDQMGRALVLSTQVQWLSGGKALVQLLEFRVELALFLMEHTFIFFEE